MFRTPLCDTIGIKYPIIQAGMGPADTTEIAAAASKVGALGVISAGMRQAVEVGRAGNKQTAVDALMDRVERVRKITKNPFGINMPINVDFADLCIDAVIDARRNDPELERQLRVVITSAGDSKPYISRLKDAGLFTIHVTPSTYHAQRMERLGIDAVIAEGFEGGGHKSPDPVHTMVLVASVAESVKIPVIAAGGIGDAKSFVAALALGAQAVQMGTRFICTSDPSGFHENVKKFMLEATDRGTVVTRGEIAPMRYVKNELSATVIKMIADGVPMEKVLEFKKDALNRGMMEGDVVHGAVTGGQIAGRIHDLPTIQELVEDRMMKGSIEVLQNLADRMGYRIVNK